MSIKYFTDSITVKPREKAQLSGVESLTDQELIALIIGFGTKNSGVMSVAEQACNLLDTSPNEKIDVQETLQEVYGLGRVKSMQIAAALEIGRRRYAPGKYTIRVPEDLWNCVRHFGNRMQEYLILICMNGAHEFFTYEIITKGLVNRSLIHPREVLHAAIMHRCSTIAVAHNHPSGHLHPSQQDREATAVLKGACEIMGIHLIDHIIFTYTDFFSFRDEGIF